jgi:hypothetical protein
MSKNELVMRPVAGSPVVSGVPDRATRVASWIGWHLFEITGVTVPAVVALTVSPWWWLVSGVVGAGWRANEVRVAKKQAAIRAGQDRPVAMSEELAENGSGETSGVDSGRAGGVR